MTVEDYLRSDEKGRAKIRHSIFQDIISSPEEADVGGLDKLSKIVLKEILIQPLATSWWIARNLEVKHNIDIGIRPLEEAYHNIQLSKISQDLIRFNSSGGKAIAVARGIALRSKTTSYYFDIQTTDICPCRCTKCWNYYQDENGRARLLPRKMKDGSALPTTEDFKRVVKQVIDLGVRQMTSTGGGEPFTNKDLPFILEFAKDYSRSVGNPIKMFVPTSGLGAVYRDDTLLEKAIRNIDLLRFSFDSLDKDTLIKSHGVSEKRYEEMIENFSKVVRMKKQLGLDLDVEILILIYGNNYSSIEYTVEKAREMGATRILFNSITGKGEALEVNDKEIKSASQVLKKVFDRYCLGHYGGLKLDFDPVLMNSLDSFSKEDLENIEPTIGDLRYCMKNVFGLTPVVTADGTFHVCFPCSQPLIANEKDIFKIGNVMENSVEELVLMMQAQYRDINPKKDCIPDCRDIHYFNVILRKIIDDYLLGIPPTSQPFLDRTAHENIFVHSMHNEKFDESELDQAIKEYGEASKKVREDQEKEFKDFAAEKTQESGYLMSLPEDIPHQLLSRYDLNLFSVGCIRSGMSIVIFSPELKIGQEYAFMEDMLIPYPGHNFEDFIRSLGSEDRIIFNYSKRL